MLLQFVQDGRNIITLGASTWKVVGLAITTVANLFLGSAIPAFQVQAPSGGNLFMVTNHGAIGVGTGATAFGSNGNCLKSGGGSGNLMSWASCGGGGGSTYTGGQGIGIDGNNVITINSTHSGSVIQASTTLASSGTLVFEGAASGSSLYLGTSLQGAGLASCSNGATSKVLWNSTSGRFSCGTDQNTPAWSSTGALQNQFDNRYVNTSGDTMTGALTINITGGGNTTIGINNRNAYSGAVITAAKNLTSSGSAEIANNLLVKGIVSGASLYVAGTTTLVGTPTGPTQVASDNSTKLATTAYVMNAITASNPAVAVQAATTTASDTSGLTYANGASGIGATFTGSNNTAITIDGYTFTAIGQRLLVKNDTQSPSGAYNGVYYVTQVQTAILPPVLTRALDYNMPSDINNTGAIPVVNGTVNATTSWVLTSSVTTVGTDALTYAQFSFAPSNILTQAGQGLTKTSNSVSLNATISGSLLKFNTVSGSLVRANLTLASSGTIVAEGAISGASLYAATSIKGSGLVDCSTAGTSKLLWASATGRFSCGTDTDTNTTYTAGQGLALTSTSFKTHAPLTGTLVSFSTVSGALVKANNTLASSGTIVAEGAISGASLYAATSFQGSGLSNCVSSNQSLQWTAASGRFSCGTPTGTTYTAGQGLTLTSTSFKTNATMTGTTLKQWSTVSGSYIQADTTLASSGTLTVKGIARFKNNVNVVGTISGAVINGIASVNSSGSMTAEGTISGANLYSATSLKGSGLVDCSTAGSSKLLWTAATGRFSCGTDQTSATSYTAGQGLTLTATSFKVNATLTGTTLKGWTTISGALITGNTIASSGAVVAEGNISGATLNIGGAVRGGSLIILSGGSSILGNLTIGSANAAHTKLEVMGTISGSLLTVNGGGTSFVMSNMAIGKTTVNTSTALDVKGTSSGSKMVSTIKSPWIPCITTASGSAVTVGSGTYFGTIPVPYSASGLSLVSVRATSRTLGGTQASKFKLYNSTKAKRQYLVTALQIDQLEATSDTAATAFTLGASLDISGNDELVWYVPQVGSSPAPTGVTLCATFQ